MAFIQTIFLDTLNKIRSIWWIPFFFVILVLCLLPTILIAQKNSVDVPIVIQAIIILIATGICQILRKEPIIQITGKFNLSWFRQFFVGLLMGAILMIFPAIILTVFGFARWQINDRLKRLVVMDKHF